ncbi:UbiA prenyltransferase family protein [Niabella ginsengisoli]|uniref:UbiA family prenyltransferase n=1 Tax=Niabella ginsengisoli TaxID=522298 RepID=A0ABS9SEM6_9BACT|nr:UbiA family prenyltransferase [Niabella ginsengisoli]MCH5596812.1 UbiA family prenyltransferase [Niabella ginsengisoli]
MRGSYNRKFFDFIVFSNIFIALCAVAMAGYSTHIFSLGFPPPHFAGFLFFSTLASYNIHWYLTDETTEITASRTYWLARNKWVHAFFFLISSVGCSYFLLQELNYIKWILPAVFLTLMYTAPKFPFKPFIALRKFILGKTILLALMWTYITSALPFFILEKQWEPAYALFFINRFSLILPICILFDLRDKEYDKATGVKTFVTLLPNQKIKKLFNSFIILNVISVISLWQYTSFSFVDNFILLIPTILTFSLYANATKTKNDYLFYFILDGLMALSPLLYFIKLYLIGTIFA